MRYPTITVSACERIADQRVKDLDPALDADVHWQGVGEDIDLQPLRSLAEDWTTAIGRLPDATDKDKIEGDLSPGLAAALTDIPVLVLDDPGFWRYLSLALFWDFIAWREHGPFEKGNHLRYVDGRTPTESVLNRMFLRARAVGPEGADLAGSLDKSTDFWRSHVIRVRTGTVPPLTRSFARSQVDHRLPTGPLRELARALNRTWTNVILNDYDEQEATALLTELKDVVQPAEEETEE